MTAFVFLAELMWRREACASFDLFIKPQFCFSMPKLESWREEWMERKDKAGRRTEERRQKNADKRTDGIRGKCADKEDLL